MRKSQAVTPTLFLPLSGEWGGVICTSKARTHNQEKSAVKKLILSALALALLAAPAAAQKFPSRTIAYLVPLAAGSTTDVAARLIAQRVSQSIGAQVVIENRPGGSTMIASAAVAKAAPDGHTILMGASSLTVAKNLFKTLPLDPEKDLLPVSLLVTAPLLLVVNPATGVKSLPEFLAKYKDARGVSFGTPGSGTMLHLAAEVFKIKSGLDLTPVFYRGGAPALTDVIAGHIPVMFATPVVKGSIDKGDVNALAVTGRKRLAQLPDVPTFAEAGLPLPEIDNGAWFGLFAPAGTPRDIVDVLNREFNAALRDEELRATLQKAGLVPHGTTPEAFAAFFQGEIERWPAIFARAGIKPQ
jgi:tripartite-type tricarboxylate transporter receptor subunit TctC